LLNECKSGGIRKQEVKENAYQIGPTMLSEDQLALWKLAMRSVQEVLRLWDIRPLNKVCSWWKVPLVQHLNSSQSSLFLLDASLDLLGIF